MDNYDLNLNVPSIETNVNETLIEIELPGGARGLQGETGPQGPKGDTGETGSKGDKGDSGVWTGSTTPPEDYDVWVIPDGTPSTVPTKLSQLTNDVGYTTFSGNYNDLTNKPTIPDELSDLSDDSTHRLVTDAEKATWNNKSNFSGSYNDLTNKPTIPDSTSDLTNDSGYITNSVNNLTNYTTTTTLTTLLGNKQNVVLSGTSTPTSSDGEDGDIYLQYGG